MRTPKRLLTALGAGLVLVAAACTPPRPPSGHEPLARACRAWNTPAGTSTGASTTTGGESLGGYGASFLADHCLHLNQYPGDRDSHNSYHIQPTGADLVGVARRSTPRSPRASSTRTRRCPNSSRTKASARSSSTCSPTRRAASTTRATSSPLLGLPADSGVPELDPTRVQGAPRAGDRLPEQLRPDVRRVPAVGEVVVETRTPVTCRSRSSSSSRTT